MCHVAGVFHSIDVIIDSLREISITSGKKILERRGIEVEKRIEPWQQANWVYYFAFASFVDRSRFSPRFELFQHSSQRFLLRSSPPNSVVRWFDNARRRGGKNARGKGKIQRPLVNYGTSLRLKLLRVKTIAEREEGMHCSRIKFYSPFVLARYDRVFTFVFAY